MNIIFPAESRILSLGRMNWNTLEFATQDYVFAVSPNEKCILQMFKDKADM